MAELYALQGFSGGMPAAGQMSQLQAPVLQVVEAEEPGEMEGEGDLSQKAGELAGALIAMAATAHQLYLQTHIAHFNIEGPTFLEVHKFLKERYEAHIDQFDALCEFVRSMDYLCPLSGPALQTNCSCSFKHIESRDMRQMLTCIFQNTEAFAMAAKELERLAQEACAPDVANYAAEIVGDCFKASWQIKSVLR